MPTVQSEIVEATAAAHGRADVRSVAMTNPYSYCKPLRGKGGTLRGAKTKVMQITVQMAPEQHGELVALSEFLGLSISEVVRRALVRATESGEWL